jgi:hypothetical protein
LSGVDPLNLVGVVTSGPKLPATSGNRMAYIDGVPVAARRSGQLLWLADCPVELHAKLLSMLGAATKVAEPAPPRSKELRPRDSDVELIHCQLTLMSYKNGSAV